MGKRIYPYLTLAERMDKLIYRITRDKPKTLTQCKKVCELFSNRYSRMPSQTMRRFYTSLIRVGYVMSEMDEDDLIYRGENIDHRIRFESWSEKEKIDSMMKKAMDECLSQERYASIKNESYFKGEYEIKWKITNSGGYTELRTCELCGKISTPKKINHRHDIYGWDRDYFPYGSKYMLCMSCYNKIKPIEKKSYESNQLKTVINKLNRSKKYEHQI